MVRRLPPLLFASLWLGCNGLAGLDEFSKVDGLDAAAVVDGGSDGTTVEGDVGVSDAQPDSTPPDSAPPDSAPPDTAPVCPAVAVVSAPTMPSFRVPTSLTLSADDVFWGRNCGTPQRCPKAGCPAGSTDVPGVPNDCALGVAAGGSFLYVTDWADRTHVCGLPGCTSPKEVTMPADAVGIGLYRALYADSSGAYMQDENKSFQRFLMKIAPGGGSTCNLGWLPGADVFGLAIVGSRIYATHGKDSMLALGSFSTTCPSAPASIQPFITEREGLSGVVAQGSTLYWTEATSIVKCENPPSCTGTPLVTGLDSHPRALASDASGLYWLTAAGIFSCPHTGCGAGPKRLSCEGCSTDYADTGRPGLQVDASHVYMLCPKTGRIVRVAK